MRISTPKSNKKLIIISSVIAAVILAGGVGAYYLYGQNKSSSESTVHQTSDSVNLDKPTQEETDAGEIIKQENTDKTPDQGTGATQDSSIIITNNVDQDNEVLRIVTNIGSVNSNGTCSLKLTKGSSVVTKDTVGIQVLSNYSTCKGWSIPLSELTSGEWTVEVTVTSGSSSKVNSSNVTI